MNSVIIDFFEQEKEISMDIPIKSSSGYSTMPIESKLISERIIFIAGDITQETAMETCKELLFLAREKLNQPIDIIINSNGGAVDAGLMILDAISTSELEIHTWCFSKAFSMAALLFSAGNKRFLFRNAKLMIHQPLVAASCIEGNAAMIKSVSESLLATSKTINEILSVNTGKSINEIEEATRTDHYYTAKEAVDFGLADKVVSLNELIKKG